MAVMPGACLPTSWKIAWTVVTVIQARGCYALLLRCCRMDAEYDAEPEVPEQVRHPAVRCWGVPVNPLR